MKRYIKKEVVPNIKNTGNSILYKIEVVSDSVNTGVGVVAKHESIADVEEALVSMFEFILNDQKLVEDYRIRYLHQTQN